MLKGEHNGRRAGGGRGLYDYGRVVDSKGNNITIRTSSSAEGPAVWLFTKDREGRDHENGIVGYPDGVSVVTPHLSVRDAKRLIEVLQRFVRDADDAE